jgi:hypothetical protein
LSNDLLPILNGKMFGNHHVIFSTFLISLGQVEENHMATAKCFSPHGQIGWKTTWVTYFS